MEKKVIMIFLLAIFCLVSASSVYAEDVQSSKNNITYVDVTGNDVWDGTCSTHITNTNHGPKFNITNGISFTNSGGSLYIASGTYDVTSQIAISEDLNIFGAGMNSTIINGGSVTRIFYINSDKHVSITNLTIMNGLLGKAGDGDDGHDGAGIYNDGTLIIDGCNIYNNVAGKGGSATGLMHSAGHGGDGGGIYNSDSGTLTITNSLIHDNSAGQGGNANGEKTTGGHGGNGGGIANAGHLTITGTSTNMVQIYNNVAGTGGNSYDCESTGGDGGSGGAIYNSKDCTVTYANIYNNIGGSGYTTSDGSAWDISGGDGGNGGAFYNEDYLNLTDCYISHNQAGRGHDGLKGGNGGDGGHGGAIYNTKNLYITNCQILNNQAGNGGNGANEYVHKSGWIYECNGGEGGQGGFGGAILNSGSDASLTIIGSYLNQNTAGNGGNGGAGGLEEYTSDGEDNLCIEDPGNGGNGGSGGAIFNTNSATINSITNSFINSNAAGNGGNGGSYADDANMSRTPTPAKAGNGGSGGAIYSDAMIGTIQNTTINNNTAGNGGNGSPVSRTDAENGGAGGNGGGLLLEHSIQIISCQINNNKAGNGGKGGNRNTDSYDNPSTDCGNGGNAGSGGGIYYYYSDNSDKRTITITNSTLNNNIAGIGGAGGIDDHDGSKSGNSGNGGSGGAFALISKSTNSKPSQNLNLTIEESTIAGNQAGYGGQPSNKGTKGSDGFGGGLYTNDYHAFTIEFCRIIDNSPQAIYLNIKDEGYDEYMQFYNNWWGSNSAPKGNVTTCSGTTMYTNYYTPWIVFSINATPNQIYPNQVSNVSTNLIMNSNNETTDTKYHMNVPDGIPVTFSSNMGTMNPLNNVTTKGYSNSTFSPVLALGDVLVFATVDYQTINTPIHVYTAGVDLNKTVNNTMPNVGDTIKFTVTAKNNGPDNATGLVITDLIPQGLSNLSYTASTGQSTYSLTSGIWNIGTLLNGVTATLEVTGTVTSALAGLNYTNYANITAINEANPNPLTANASFYVPCVNITVFQHPWYFDSESQTYQTVSSYYNTIVYDVDVLNTGVDGATGVVVKEVLGEGYQLVGLSTDGVGTTSYDSLNRIITWNIALLPAGTKAVLTLNALVTGTGNNTPNLVVNASLDQVDQYNVGAHNWSDWSVYVAPSADIQINQTQQVSNETDGQYITYTITAINNGPDEATAIQVTDNLPLGLVDPLVLPSIGTYKLNSNQIVWTIDSLANGSSAVLIAKAKINTTTGTLVNTATKTSQGDFDWEANNNAQTCILTLSGNYTPEVNMDVKQYPWYYNDKTDTYQTESGYYKTIVYSVVVKNSGPNAATGVIVKELLGDGYQFLNCTTKGDGTASFDSATNTITWNIGYMPTGGKVCLSVFALVIATGNNTPDLTVNASLVHVDQYDIPGSPKWASYSIYVPSTLDPSLADNKGDLFLNLISGDSNVHVGDLITLKYKLGNYGPSDATDVKVKIHIPEGLEFVDANVDVGTCYYDNATRTLVWILPLVKVGDPYLDLHLRGLENGNYILRPIITSPTYLLSAGDIISPVNINVAAGGDINNGNSSNGNTGSVESVGAASSTVGMQETGAPLPAMVLAILMVLSGLLMPRRK